MAQEPVELEPPVKPGASKKQGGSRTFDNSEVEAVMSKVVEQRKALAAHAQRELERVREAEEEAAAAEAAHRDLMIQLGMDPDEDMQPSDGKGYMASALGVMILFFWLAFGPDFPEWAK